MQDAAMFAFDDQNRQDEYRPAINTQAMDKCKKWIVETRHLYRNWSPMPDCDLLAALGIEQWWEFDWTAPDAFYVADHKLDRWLNWHEEDPEDPSGGISQDDLDFFIP